MEWFLENLESLFFIVTTVVTAASAVAALTPNPKDDSFMAQVRKLVDKLAINVGKAKE